MGTVNLGGTDYQISPLNLNVLERLQDRWECDLDKLFKEMQKRLDKQGPRTLKFLVSSLLIDQYPEMDEQKVGSLIDLTNAPAMTEAIIKSFDEG